MYLCVCFCVCHIVVVICSGIMLQRSLSLAVHVSIFHDFLLTLCPGSIQILSLQAGPAKKLQFYAEPLSIIQVRGRGARLFQRAAQSICSRSQSCFHVFFFLLALSSWRTDNKR